MDFEKPIVIASLNCQGLGSKEKRKDVLNFLKQKQHSIYCLQDTHFTRKEEKYIRSMWGFDCYFNSYTSQSRGTAIFLNNNFEHKVLKTKSDTDGNKLILDMLVGNKKITLINIYGPNQDNPCFYEQIKKDIQEFQNDSIILTGDFNLIMDKQKDTKNYFNINNPKARQKVLDICEEFNLVDVWRELNIEKKQFTWRTKDRSKQGRLLFSNFRKLIIKH